MPQNLVSPMLEHSCSSTYWPRLVSYTADDFVTWIVDDDSLFYADLSGGEHKQIPYFQIIAEHRNTDIDAMVGMVTDAPPLPFTSTIRTQLTGLLLQPDQLRPREPR